MSNTTGTQKPITKEDLQRMAKVFEQLDRQAENLPLYFLLTDDDYPRLLREMQGSYHPMVAPSAFLGIPFACVQGLRVSVALMRDGTTQPIVKKP
jgi:hypothetical protein